MGTHNTLRTDLTCPHCGEASLFSVECNFGCTRDVATLRIGDSYPWVPRKAIHNGGRPPEGTVVGEGYADCERCGLDFFVDVQIHNDVIVSATPNLTQPGYKTRVGEGYFAPGELDRQDARMDHSYRSWYSKHLSAMGEPSLLVAEPTTTEAYRFLWLRTFHHPIAVTAISSQRGTEVRFVELDGAGGYAPGTILASATTPVTLEAWNTLTVAVGEAGLWNGVPAVGSTGIDGAQWVLEGIRAGTRSVAHRWSPDEGPFRDAGLLFISLAGLTPDSVY